MPVITNDAAFSSTETDDFRIFSRVLYTRVAMGVEILTRVDLNDIELRPEFLSNIR